MRLRPYRLAVRTAFFQEANRGSTPLRAANEVSGGTARQLLVSRGEENGGVICR